MSFQPEVFGKYYLVDKIAVGGMAEIFKAKIFGPGGFEKILVIKRILTHLNQNDDFVEMFIDEARICSTLNHSNIIHIFDFGKIKENHFIAMEYLEGRDLKSMMKKCQQLGRPLPVEYAVYVVHEMCKGLDHAHRKRDSQGKDLNILHRDISPSNVLISYEEGKVKLADFGIAKAEGATYQTRDGVLKGKFEYMSPEQASAKVIDRRSDIFATSIVLYELLTRKRLFKAGSDIETLEMIRNPNIPPPSYLNPQVPEELDRIVMKGLAVNVDDRYQEAWEMQRDLREFMRPSSPDLIALSLSNFMKEIFKREIEQERDRLEQGSRAIREKVKNGQSGEELALEEAWDVNSSSSSQSSQSDASTPNPSGTQISLAMSTPTDNRRSTAALAVVFVVMALMAGIYLWFGGEDPGQTSVTATRLPEPTAAPLEKPKVGTLVVDSVPPNVKIFLQGKQIADKTPLIYREVPFEQTLTLRAEADGYRPSETTIYITADQPRERIRLELEKSSSPTTTRPPDVAPATTTRPRTNEPPPTSVATRPPDPVPAPSNPGTLDFTSSPAGAQVFVDNRKVCEATPCSVPASNPDVTVQVSMRMAGRVSFTDSVKVPAGQRVAVKGTLAAGEVGYLTLTIKDTVSAEIVVDGQVMGYSPFFQKLALPAGKRQVVLRNASVGTKTLEVDIKPGEVTTVKAVDLRN